MASIPLSSRPRFLRSIFLCLILCGLFSHPPCLMAANLSGQVIAVPGGDQILLQTDQGQRLRIKLAGIRTPAGRATGIDIGKRHLHMLLAGRFVSVEVILHAPGGVILGRVLHGGADIALRLLKAGLAEAATGQPSLAPNLIRDYRQAEQQARSRGMGYWQTGR